MLRIRAIVPALCALSIAACGGSGGGGGYATGPNGGGTNNPPANPNSVTLTTAIAYNPAALTVAKGTTVSWNWNSCSTDPYGGDGSSTCVSHSVTFDDGTTSPTQSSGSFTRTFNTAGTYKYHCLVHGTAMSGQVVVTE